MFPTCIPARKTKRHFTSGCARLRHKMRIISKFWIARVFGLFCLVLFAATSLAQTVLQTNQVSAGAAFPDAARVPAAKADPVSRSGGDSTVRLGTGDLIEVSVYNVPELSTKTRVGGGGDVYLPLIDYVH